MARTESRAARTKAASVDRVSKLSRAVLALVAIAVILQIAPAYIYWFGDISSLKIYEAATEKRYIDQGGAPEPIESKIVKPIAYLNAPQLKDLNSSERKKRFIETILPSILIVKHKREQERLLAIAIAGKFYPTRLERRFMRDLFEGYRVKNIDDLSLKMLTHPNSVAIAQAALESAWGTSNVFLETNNMFGVWSFNINEPRHMIVVRGNKRQIFFRRYDSIYSSIEDYFKVVAIGKAFEGFRKARAESNDSINLVGFLEAYSVQRKEYVRKLRYVIESNDLTRFDDYSLDKESLFLKAAL
ncbi:MAG: glucosaminidase domain-containing protein [Helicobacteraceae bacterium]|jgi:Bax protein|nr:glucosaminidase domain-containing protein [Helicobacteraceae bacterium]